MNNFSVRRRTHRRRIDHPAFNPKSPQVERTSQVTSPYVGASVAIRPQRTALRRMDNRGAGEVGYY